MSLAGMAILGGCGGGSSSGGGGSTGICVAVAPTTASVATSATQSFTATVSNDSAAKGVMWAASCATAGGCGVVVGDDERFGNGGDVHGACGGAESGDGDADGDIGERWDEVGVGDDHDYFEWAATDGSGGDDFAEGDGIGGEPVAGTDGDGDERCWRSGRDVDGEHRNIQRAGGGDGDICCAEFAGSGDYDHGDEQGRSDEERDGDDRGDGSSGSDDVSQRLARDGANNQEYLLTTANVKQASFGKLFACTVDGAVYAQPLWVPNVAIGGGTHNVIVVATMRDSVYVFDADTNNCANPYWKKTLIPSGETYGASADVFTGDIFGDIGILGTPVIDPASKTIYLVTKTKTTTPNYIQRLHALNLGDGRGGDEFAGDDCGDVSGDVRRRIDEYVQRVRENQRPGLALSNGMVYIAWASHGDEGTYHGWVLGYQTANLTAVPTVFNSTPNTASGLTYCKGGIWMSGGAPAFDAAGNMYVMTGNGAFDGTSGSTTLPTDFGDSFLKLSTPNLGVLDYFTPMNQSTLDTNDSDVGASGTSVLIDGTGGGNFLVGGSKAGSYLRDGSREWNGEIQHERGQCAPGVDDESEFALVFDAGVLE